MFECIDSCVVRELWNNRIIFYAIGVNGLSINSSIVANAKLS